MSVPAGPHFSCGALARNTNFNWAWLCYEEREISTSSFSLIAVNPELAHFLLLSKPTISIQSIRYCSVSFLG